MEAIPHSESAPREYEGLIMVTHSDLTLNLHPSASLFVSLLALVYLWNRGGIGFGSMWR